VQAQLILNVVQQAFFFFAISQLALRFFSPQQTPQQTPGSSSYDQNTQPVVNPWQLDPQTINPIIPLGSKVAVHVYLSQSFGWDMFSKNEREVNGNLPSVSWDNLTWGDWSWSRSAEYLVDIPEVMHLTAFLDDIIEMFVSRLSRITVLSLPIST
jgi:hypothetical protein